MVSVLCIAQGLGLGLYAVFNQSSVFLTKIDNPTRGHSGMSQGRPKADLCKQTEKVRPNSRYTNQQGSNATSDQNRDLTEGRYLQNNPAHGWTSRTVYHRQGRNIGCVVIDTPRKALALTVSGLLHLEERLD